MESDIIYNYLLESFRALYGKTVTPKWHYGYGHDRPPTSCHMSIDGLRQGDAPATVYFNILAARIYRKQLALLTEEGSSLRRPMTYGSWPPHLSSVR